MKKESLSKKFMLNGFECELAIVDSEYLMSLKKHPRNRPSGDVDENECCYSEDDVKKAKNHIKELYKQFKITGFEPSVKQFRIGILNGVSYKLDGQHTIGALRRINNESLKSTGKPEYDEFIVFIKDFKDNTNAFLRELNLINNHNQGFKCSSYGYTTTDENVPHYMTEISKKLGITTENAMRILFGNLSNKEYQNKAMTEAKKNWEICVDTLGAIFSVFDDKDANDVTKLLRNKDAFIVINELVSNICHKKYLIYRKIN